MNDFHILPIEQKRLILKAAENPAVRPKHSRDQLPQYPDFRSESANNHRCTPKDIFGEGLPVT